MIKRYPALLQVVSLFVLLLLPAKRLFAVPMDTAQHNAIITTIAENAGRSFPMIDAKMAANHLTFPVVQRFTPEQLAFVYPSDSSSSVEKDTARGIFSELDRTNRYATVLAPEELNTLPIGLSNNTNENVQIAISAAIFHPDYAELTAYARVKIPQQPGELFFGITGLKLSYTGGIIGDARLVLLGDVPIPINGGSAAIILKGSLNKRTGVADPDLTYVTIDCSGFKEMGIAADVIFPRGMLVPLKSDGERDENPSAQVKAAFKTVVSNWNDILVSIDLPAFEITPLKGIGFRVGQAVFDASDLRNSSDIMYPPGYQQKYMSTESPNLWRGVYIRNLEVMLPRQFADKNSSSKRVSFGATNLLIDNNGITGSLFGRNVLPNGSASGWRFSVDKFNIDLEANHLVGAGFDGIIGLPVMKDPLQYTAVITADNEYVLKLNPLTTLSFDVWKAKAELDANSWVRLALKDGKFQPEAMLNGRMGITVTDKPDSTGTAVGHFSGIVFQDLHLQTKAPYITTSYFGYKGDSKMSNFPVSLTEIGLRATEQEAALYFGVKISLMQDKFGGDTRVEMVGRMVEGDGLQSWKFDKLRLDEIAIHADISNSINIEGRLKFYRDDAVYGNAIGGYIKAGFLQNKIKGEAHALFGSTTFRYWYVDAKVSGFSIPIVPPLNISGFGGGAYYHMKKNGTNPQATPTGVNYVPDESTGLGLKATVVFNAVKDQVVNGDVTFEIAFNSNGGLNFIGFFGYATILKVLPSIANGKLSDFVADKFQKLAEAEKKLTDNLGVVGEKLNQLKVSDPSKIAKGLSSDEYRAGENGLSAYVGIQYDFQQSTFHANFDLYLNVAGGIIQGTASGNRAGWAVIHIAPGEWYFHMGTPTNRLGVKFGVGSISIKTGAYLMVGDHIPGSPPPPPEVADILGVDMQELDYMRDLNALGDGRGFAFGANLSIETGDLTFLILYANFKCGVGFDIMLKDYGQDVHCKGSNEPIGMDGWYANGQSYVYLQGEVGVKVNLRFIKGRFPIISGAAAVLMQAKLPNPTWMRGYMAVKFSLLGGLVSGNMRMKITIGSECELVTGSSPVDVKIISDVTPSKGAADVDVFAAPAAAFNMRMNKAFDVEDDNGTKTYRVKLDTFFVSDNGVSIPGRVEWNNNMDGVTFYSKEVLPPKKQLKATVRVTFEELVSGKWQLVYVNGQQSNETEERDFTTGTAPDYIPVQNIDYAYPVLDQKNYYKDEHNKGYVVLKRGQSYLFDPRWSYTLQVTGADGKPQRQQMAYNVADQRIDYDMATVKTNETYSIDVVAAPPGASATESFVSYQTNDAGDDGSFTMKNNKAGSVTRGDVTKSLLGYAFHASKYATLQAKISAIPVQSGVSNRVSSDVISLQAEVGKYEYFDVPELTGTAYTAYLPLVQVTAVPEDDYYMKDIYPLVYQQYPMDGNILISKRDTLQYGVVPLKAMTVMSDYLMDVTKGDLSWWLQTRLPYTYNLPMIYNLDFLDLQTQVVNRSIEYPALMQQYSKLVTEAFPFIRPGKYKVKYQYVLPGNKAGTSTTISYPNPIK
ncbi:hypothetical protein CLV59_101365 [Chitinophaga dinghuensis]|uniref:Uncharacterized protein n=1 Tax=Chitinophaga dinghuensis TaxID=1539050 RepID=A0A327WIL1_9BACT|nr:hypothetical protein [Chitinophaga dinghuensis]RAJ87604.1 hypothetical protein CLV59_101365 [Chitinophaga dinghuensis]